MIQMTSNKGMPQKYNITPSRETMRPRIDNSQKYQITEHEHIKMSKLVAKLLAHNLAHQRKGIHKNHLPDVTSNICQNTLVEL